VLISRGYIGLEVIKRIGLKAPTKNLKIAKETPRLALLCFKCASKVDLR